jgi:hypothetical protein
MEGKRRRRWVDWAVGVLLVFVVYPLSFGPIEFLSFQELIPVWEETPIEAYSRPMWWFVDNGPMWFLAASLRSVHGVHPFGGTLRLTAGSFGCFRRWYGVAGAGSIRGNPPAQWGCPRCTARPISHYPFRPRRRFRLAGRMGIRRNEDRRCRSNLEV